MLPFFMILFCIYRVRIKMGIEFSFCSYALGIVIILGYLICVTLSGSSAAGLYVTIHYLHK